MRCSPTSLATASPDSLGLLEEAIQPLEKAVTLAEQTGDMRQLMRALLFLADVLRSLRRPEQAVEMLARAAETAKEIGDSSYQEQALLTLSLTHTYLGQVPAALEVADQLQRLASDTGDPLPLGGACDARSVAYVMAKRWDDAFTAAGQAIDIYTSAGIHHVSGYPGNVQGIARLGQGRIEEAVALLTRASAYGSAGEFPRAEGLCLYNLAWANWMARRYDAANEAAQQAVEVFRRIGGPDVAASEEFVRATAAMLEGDEHTAGMALTRTAVASRGNSDLAPAEWLLAEADKLCEEPVQ